MLQRGISYIRLVIRFIWADKPKRKIGTTIAMHLSTPKVFIRIKISSEINMSEVTPTPENYQTKTSKPANQKIKT